MTVTDISHHQNDAGRIDWTRVKQSLAGAYIKTTERSGYTDPKWLENYNGLAGVPRGAYHFCGNSITKRYEDPVAEANNFANVYLSRKWEMRPAYDIELAGATPAWLWAFRAQFRRRTGVTADRVYTSQSMITTVLRPELWLDGLDTDLWIARYTSGALGFAHPKLALWQYTQSGTWPGFPGKVDLNREMNAWPGWPGAAAEQEDDMDAHEHQLLVDIHEALFTKRQPSRIPGDQNTTVLNDAIMDTVARVSMNEGRLNAANAKIDGLAAAVAALSNDPDLDLAAVKQIVQDAVKQNLQITGTVQIGASE